MPFLDLSKQFKEIMVILNGSNHEQSSQHVLENMIPDAEIILHTVICCRRIMRWDGRRRLIVDGHTLPGTDLMELLEYAVLPYHKNIPKPQGKGSFTVGRTRIGAEPRHIGNQCIRLVIVTGNNTQNAVEPEYDSQEESDMYNLTFEPDTNDT